MDAKIGVRSPQKAFRTRKNTGRAFAALKAGKSPAHGIAVSRIDVLTREMAVVASPAVNQAIGGILRKWFGLAPDGSILMVAPAKDWDIYALDLVKP